MEEFDATIHTPYGGGAYVGVPSSVVSALGGSGRIPVVATFDGITYRGSVVSMGGEPVIGVLKAIRSALGKGAGDRVHVTLVRDDGERTVDVPADLGDALTQAGLAARFDKLSYSHQREYVTWIEEAKRPDTRARRIRTAIERISE